MFRRSQLILRYGVFIGLAVIIAGLILGERLVSYLGASIISLTPISSLASVSYDLYERGKKRDSLLGALIIVIIAFSVVVSELGP